MKSIWSLTAPVLVFVAIGVGSAFADNLKTVQITNNTSFTLTEVFASPSSSSADWDTTNNLFSGTLIQGATGLVNVDDGLGDCTYDLMAVLNGAQQPAYQYQVNACNNGDGGASWTISN